MVVILIVGGEPSAPSPPFTNSTTVSILSSGSQVSLDDPIATTKEEEWVKRKKVEVVKKRQIATRVQREVVLEDGKVVQDSGPKVTTTTTEDTEKQESENTEHHDIDDGGAKEIGWQAVGDPSVVKEIREKKVTTREEKKETIETEDIKHLGDISDEAYRRAIGSGDIGKALTGLELQTVGPRIVGQSCKTHKITDTEDSLKTSGIDAQGNIVTNTTTTREHEEVNEEDLPEGNGELGSEEDRVKETSHHYSKTKDQEFVDYVVDGVKIGTEMRYNAETSRGTRLGEWDSLSERLKARRNRFLKESEQDRKDALTRCPLDIDQEERTRKAETSKWLEHHFGSESASRSSRDSDDEAGPPPGFINVTMKSAKDVSQSKVFLSSPEPEPEPERLYFKGISQWKSEERNPPGRIQVLPTGPDHTFKTSSPSPSPSKSPSPPHIHNGNQIPPASLLTKTTTTKYYERTSSPYGRNSSSPIAYNGGSRVSPIHSKLNGKSSREHTPPNLSPPPRRRNRKPQRDEEGVREEPAPDYSPVSEPRSSPHRITPDIKRKVYQRTRFAADIPPPPQQQMNHHPHGHPGGQPQTNGKHKTESKRSLGQSFRRLVGKFRSNSGERKKKGKQRSGGEHDVVDSGTQTPGEMQRYYLGEDPFQGSIYGRESEYDGVSYRRKYRREEESRQHSSQGSSTLGRLSKSTGRLSGPEKPIQNGGTTLYYTDRGGVQTLPRKLQEHKVKKEVHVTRSNGETPSDRYRLGNNSSSMFNVSIVNNVSSPSYLNGPAKPARTYRSNLARSKSFAEPSLYTSNPQLSRLREQHAPLKSPGIVTSISRSTRDISEAIQEEDSRRSPLVDQNRFPKRGSIEAKKKIFMKGLMERAPELYRTLHGSEADENRNSPEPRYTSTPLNNGRVSYSPLGYSYTNGDHNRSVVRRGSNDYTETVRYTTKSEDPLRPSVTDTVQSFTKKTVPGVGGRRETIQSTETKTVTKSRFRSGTPDLKYSSPVNGGVIIEVRNTRK